MRSIAGRPTHSILVFIAIGALVGCGSPANPPAATTAGEPSAAATTAATAPATQAAPSASEPTVAAASPTPASPEASAAPSAVPPVSPIGSVKAVFNPANFVGAVDNPWFPLKPGATFVFKGLEGGARAVDTFTVTTKTKMVGGVKATVVLDLLTRNGRLEERTEDWYAQDRDGNVWYLGEATAELDSAGHVISTEGSWQTGVNGAEPGIYMPAKPEVGFSARQEHFRGHAEDHFVVLLTNGKANVPVGSFRNVLVTAEWTPLEPDIISEKAYVKGIGQIREADVVGSTAERLELVKVTGQ